MSGRDLSRRTFLRGTGVALALPWLPSLLPRAAWSAPPPAAPPRFVALYAPCGAYMPSWTPPTFGALGALSPSLAPLEPYRSRATVISGLDATATASEFMGFHRRATASWLTCTAITPTYDPAQITNGWSIDQLLADSLHADAPVPSVQVGQPLVRVPEDPTKPYSPIYLHTLSWRGDQPMMAASRPEELWRKLVGGLDTPSSEADAALMKARGRSVLDAVLADLHGMKVRLGLEDAARLDDYLTSVRALEREVQEVAVGAAVCEDASEAFAAREGWNYDDHVDLMFGLVAQLFACDATRVATLQISSAGPSRVFRDLGHELPHHEYTHHNGNADWIRRTEEADHAQTGFLVRFLDELAGRTAPGGEGTLLDETLVLYGSGMGDGSMHDWRNCPMLYVGDAGGRLRLGRHVDATGRPLADLHLTVLQAMGLEQDRFADSSGVIEGIQAS